MSAGGVQFNLQQFLSDMREEQREDIRVLSGKVDTGFNQVHGRISAVQTKVNDHETRIVVVENARRLMMWLAGVTVVAILGAAASYVLAFVKP